MTEPPRPTSAELSILRVLWDLGPATARDIHERLSKGEDLAYTSVLKTLQIMFAKGLVKRDDRQRSHVYRAARPAEQTQRGLVKDLIDKAFGGSAAALAVRALSSHRVTKAELEEVKRFLEAMADEDAGR